MSEIADSTLSYVDSPSGGPRLVTGPYLVLAMEAMRPFAPSERWFLDGTDSVVIGRAKRRGHEREASSAGVSLRIDVPDGWMSGSHAKLSRDGSRWLLSDDGSKNGTFVAGKRVTSHVLQDGDQFAAGNTMFLFHAEGKRAVSAPADAMVDGSAGDLSSLATLNPDLARDFEALRRVARSNVPVIAFGESGSGKEVIARALHDLSGRSGAFTAINCGALPENLIESELFGYRKGAFSGATEDRKGLIRAADNGTLFLDEIAELPEGSQTKLLRVLQERVVVPIGGTQPVRVDIRVVAATHQDLPQRIADKRFRQDLYARLSGFEFTLPPLRDRREDIGFICAALLKRVGADPGLQFERPAARQLFHYDWPLNVRELDQALNAALALADGAAVGLEHLPRPVRDADAQLSGASDSDEALKRDVIAAMERHAGNISAIARDLGKARVQIRRWCKRFGIDPASYRR